MPDYNVPVRNWLVQQGLTNIGWDNKNKTVLLNGKPFLLQMDPVTGAPLFSIKDGRSYSNASVLTNALKQYFLNTAQQNATPNPFGQAVEARANQPPAWETTPNNEPGAGPGTENPTEAQSAQPIAEAQKNGTLPINTESPYYEPASQVGAIDVGTNNQPIDNAFTIQERISENNLISQAGSYEDLLKKLSQPNPLIGKINEIWGQRLKASLDSLQASFDMQKQSLEAQTGKIKANHAGEIQAIEQAILKARQRTKTDMNARGLYFSGVLTKALTGVEEKGLSLKAKALAQETAELDDVAGKIAVLTSNYAISKDKVTNLITAEKGAEQLKILEQDQAKRDKIELIIAGINAKLKAMKVTAKDREKIWGMQQEQAKQESEQKQMQQNFDNWVTTKKLGLQYQSADLATRKEMYNEWLNGQNLSLKQKNLALNAWYKQQLVNNAGQKEEDIMTRFRDTMNYNYAKLNASQAYHNAMLSLKGAGAAGSLSSSGLGDIFAGGLTGITKALSGVNRLAISAGNDVVKKSANDASTVLAFAQQVATDTAHIDLNTNMHKVGREIGTLIGNLDVGSADQYIAHVLSNNYAKAVASLLAVANGDGDEATRIYQRTKDKVIQTFGLDPNVADQIILTMLEGASSRYSNYGNESNNTGSSEPDTSGLGSP